MSVWHTEMLEMQHDALLILVCPTNSQSYLRYRAL